MITATKKDEAKVILRSDDSVKIPQSINRSTGRGIRVPTSSKLINL